ncbi:hypothetical protein AC1031_006167 [Aphanomyces cochlioides]|nr:hypothetical protein AC1031_006167 [Aphanomyces cochlioides]
MDGSIDKSCRRLLCGGIAIANQSLHRKQMPKESHVTPLTVVVPVKATMDLSLDQPYSFTRDVTTGSLRINVVEPIEAIEIAVYVLGKKKPNGGENGDLLSRKKSRCLSTIHFQLQIHPQSSRKSSKSTPSTVSREVNVFCARNHRQIPL